MKKSILFNTITILAMMLAISLPAGAQTLVKGVLLDSLTNEGEPYATIRFAKKSAPNTPVALAATGMQGEFQEKVNGKGEFIAIFSSVGKGTVVKPFTLGTEKTLDLGKIYISDDVKMLGGVEVVAQKPLVKMEVDKLNYSVEDDPDAKTYTVMDMLRKVPMVTVDGNDNITVNGSSSFKVYVDGRPNAMISSNASAVFKSMPASMIKSIEVITNPGARYDAEGVGGVLNIVTTAQQSGKKITEDGTSVTLRAMGNTKGYSYGAYVTSQKGKLTLSANGNEIYTKIKDITTDMNRTQTTSLGNALTYMHNELTTDSRITMGSLDASYDLDTLNLITANFGIRGLSTPSDATTLNKMSGGYYGTGFGYSTINSNDVSNFNINGSLDFQHSFAHHKGRLFTASYRLSSTPGKNDTYSEFESDGTSTLNLTNRWLNEHSNTIEHTFQFDYSMPLAAGQTFDAGAKYIFRNNHSNSKYYTDSQGNYVFDDVNSMNYRHNNNIVAAYSEYAYNKMKYGFKAGLRYEYTFQDVKYLRGKGEDFTSNYGNLVPSASLSYTLSQSQNIGLTYNMRISRPGITYLNPYVNTQDPTTISYGNTNLKSEQANNFGLVYNLFNAKWIVNLNLRYSFCSNGIEGYSFYKDNILNSTYGNIVKRQNSGLSAFINWNAGKNTRIYANESVSYIDVHSNELDMSNHGWSNSLFLGFQQTLPWAIRLSANLMTGTKTQNLQGWNSGYTMDIFSLSKTFLKDKLSVNLAAVNMICGDLKMNVYSHGKDFESMTKTSVPIRMATISISYTFGGKQAKVKKSQKTINNDDLINKQSQSEQIGTVINN